MIAGIFHEGSGIGNQLHRYVMTRVLAADKGVDFGMIYPENFKAKSFMDLNMGISVSGLFHEYMEPKVLKEGNDIRPYDHEGVKAIKDFTLIDGEFQGEEYYKHRLEEINEWLKVEPMEMPGDLCVIGFRGGEYVGVQDLFLPRSYWEQGVAKMKEINPNMRFEVHTDDIETALQFFPDFKCTHGPEHNWRSVRYAKYLLIANSSFYILPTLLGVAKTVIAPKFWAGYNKGYWQLEQNQYSRFTYI